MHPWMAIRGMEHYLNTLIILYESRCHHRHNPRDSEGWHGDYSHCITQTNKYFLVGGLDIHAIIIQ